MGAQEKILVSKKVSVSVSKNFGIKKSIGIGFEKFLDSFSFKFWVSSHTGGCVLAGRGPL